MNIDFKRLLQLLFPTLLRRDMTAITAIGAVLQLMYDEFRAWQADIRLQASTTCQVMYLELMLNYRLLNTFNRVIYITDADGISTDFIINIPESVTVDYSRLQSLINKYKLYGKRFSTEQSTYAYDVVWTNYVCEKKQLQIGEYYSGGYVGAIIGVQYQIVSPLGRHNWSSSKLIASGMGSGWHLPSYIELQQFVGNRDKIGIQYNEELWSSDEQSTDEAIAVRLYQGGNTISFPKTNVMLAWAVKSIATSSGFVNSGYQRARTLRVIKYESGLNIGFDDFDVRLQFVFDGITYQSVDVDYLSTMPMIEYIERINAYAGYITNLKQNDYPGIFIKKDKARIENNDSCPINN